MKDLKAVKKVAVQQADILRLVNKMILSPLRAHSSTAVGAAAPKKGHSMLYQFVWKHNGERVFITGNFDNWKCSLKLAKNNDTGLFETIIRVDPREKLIFKFIVDGVWRCSMDFPTEFDDMQNVNNVIYPDDVQVYLKKCQSRSTSPANTLSSSCSSLRASPLSHRDYCVDEPIPSPFGCNSRISSSNFSSLAFSSAMISLFDPRSSLDSYSLTPHTDFTMIHRNLPLDSL